MLRACESGQTWSVTTAAPLRLGRCTSDWADVDVKLTAMSASKLHAEIHSPDGIDYVITNLSKNGLEVDGKRIGIDDTCTLRSGCRIEIGTQLFEFNPCEYSHVSSLELEHSLVSMAHLSGTLGLGRSGHPKTEVT